MYWKLALAQHPMYLLIKEDTMCAERTPPWGAPDIDSYITRLRQNLATLRHHPEIKIGYEWSALELEQLARDAPDVFTDILDLAKAGRCTFYNGTYSQPHLQTLSSESNYRQFEWGAKVYRELCDNHQVLVYAHQESSVNDQTPQLLKAFRIRYAVLPRFLSTLTMLDGGEFLFHSRYGLMFTHGEEFADWRGLDGTVIPLFLVEPNHMPIKDWINFQEILQLSHVPPIMIEMPDLVVVDEQWIDNRSRAEFVLLDDALEERRQQFPPRFQIRLHTNWSYIEGIRAEELARENWNAEVSVLRAEAINSLAFGLLKRTPESSHPIWKKILTMQHHDAYCFCAPELREKSIQLLREAESDASHLANSAAQAIIGQINTSALDEQTLVVFNTLPHRQEGVVSIQVDNSNSVVADLNGNELASEVTSLPENKSQVRFIANMSGLGYRSFRLKAGSQKPITENIGGGFIFENSFYRATVQPDGTFSSISVKPLSEELLEGNGNLLAACDSTGLGSTHEGTFDVSRPSPKWEPSKRGPELKWQCTSEMFVRRSSLGATLYGEGKMCPAVQAALVIHFYNALARIDLDWMFSFNDASIGHFFDDDTKLRVQWPLAFAGSIHHDIAFGVIEARAERTFLPASWVDISDERKGLAYFHKGILKHWVNGQTLTNLFAWGEDTDAIGNRVDMTRWAKSFDQRLRGTHTIHTAIYPHPGDWRTANVIGAARSFRAPPIAYVTDRHPGKLPAEINLFELSDSDLVSTAVKAEDGRILCRLYSIKPTPATLEMVVNGVKLNELSSIAGEPLNSLNPFQIAHLYLEPNEYG